VATSPLSIQPRDGNKQTVSSAQSVPEKTPSRLAVQSASNSHEQRNKKRCFQHY